MYPTSAPASGGTTTDRILDRIRSDIVSGVHRPGSRVKIGEFSELYGISPIPVREALRTLQGEGLIEFVPHRGATIRGVDGRFIANIYEIREALDGLLAEKAAERADPPLIDALWHCVESHEAAGRAGDRVTLLESNHRLHALIYAAAANREAEKVLDRGRVLIESLRTTLGWRNRRLDQTFAEHRALVRALAAGDAASAGRIAREHVVGAKLDLLEGLAKAG